MKRVILLLIMFFIISTFIYGQIILIRPNAAIGYLNSEDNEGLAINYGIRILLSASDFQRFGILLDHLFITNNDSLSYLRTGLMLEQVLFKYFNMGHGTIGYINLIDKGDYPFGIYTYLGFEYNVTKIFLFISIISS